MSTRIPGPYVSIAKDDKKCVQGAIPETLYDKTFRQRFTERGAQDRIVTSLFAMFIRYCDEKGLPSNYQPTNESQATKILNEMHSKLFCNNPTSLL